MRRTRRWGNRTTTMGIKLKIVLPRRKLLRQLVFECFFFKTKLYIKHLGVLVFKLIHFLWKPRLATFSWTPVESIKFVCYIENQDHLTQTSCLKYCVKIDIYKTSGENGMDQLFMFLARIRDYYPLYSLSKM